MKLALDTNILIDILQRREPYFANSYLVLLNAIENGDLCMMPVSAMTDVAYILRKTPDVQAKLMNISTVLKLNDVTESDLEEAVSSSMKDFEDAFLAANARRHKADYIITRNISDYEHSPVKAISPDEFLLRIGC